MSSAQDVTPDLSVIIPVYNAADTLERLVDDLLAISDLSLQIILIDDCSADDSAALLKKLAKAHAGVEALFHKENAGAGIARNTGFAHAKGEFTIFFDADDMIHGDVVVDCVASLRATGADLAMMPYFYRRDTATNHDAMNYHDAQTWNRQMNGEDVKLTSIDKAAPLLGFSNYPWNKILLTERYKQIGLRFGRTTVNNDILGHWYSLLFAREIVLINREICTHIVSSGGANLTNQHSRVRMQLFDALEETYDVLEAHPHMRIRYSHHFWSLCIRVMRWARVRISDDLRTEFDLNFKNLMMRMDLHDYARIRMKRSPDLSDDIVKSLLM